MVPRGIFGRLVLFAVFSVHEFNVLHHIQPSRGGSFYLLFMDTMKRTRRSRIDGQVCLSLSVVLVVLSEILHPPHHSLSCLAWTTTSLPRRTARTATLLFTSRQSFVSNAASRHQSDNEPAPRRISPVSSLLYDEEKIWIQSIRNSSNLLEIRQQVAFSGVGSATANYPHPLPPRVAIAALHRISQLVIVGGTMNAPAPASESEQLHYYNLSRMIWEQLQMRNSGELIRQLPVKSLIQCWNAVHILRLLPQNPDGVDDDFPSGSSSRELLYKRICERLTKGDALAKLSVTDMAHILSNLASSLSSRRLLHVYRDPFTEEERALLRAVTRRLRKHSVRRSASSKYQRFKIIEASSRLLTGLQRWTTTSSDANDDTNDVDCNVLLQDYVRVMIYTLTKDVLTPISTTASSSSSSHDIDDVFPSRQQNQSWTMQQMAILCQVTDLLLLSSNDTASAQNDPIVQGLINIFDSPGMWDFDANANNTIPSTYELVPILEFMEQYRKFLDDASVSELIQKLGTAFLDFVRRITMNNGDRISKIKPRHVNSILRCAFLLTKKDRDDEAAFMETYWAALRILFLDNNKTFPSNCGAAEVSNFAWLQARRQHYRQDTEVLEALLNRMLEVGRDCSPKLACRALSAFTTLVTTMKYGSKNKDRQDVSNDKSSLPITKELNCHQLLFELFELLGEQLLLSSSQQLTPLDISLAVHGYAKAAYVRDLGIFDHLVQLLASRVDECTARSVSQSLWSCGKMYQWEHQHQQVRFDVDVEQEDELLLQQPYKASAVTMARFLADNVNSMSTKDVAQALWALGRLQIDETDIVSPLAERAKSLVTELKEQELSNILWALSKVKSKDSSVLCELTRRLTSDGSLSLSPQDAATILYALGRLNIRDVAIFESLSDILMDHLESTSALAIANVLWAHRAVHIAPPQKLLDGWATKKTWNNRRSSTQNQLLC